MHRASTVAIGRQCCTAMACTSDTGGMRIRVPRAGRHARGPSGAARDAASVKLVHQQWSVQPQRRLGRYGDLYGSPCVRLILPAGRSVLRYDAVTLVPDATEDTSQLAPQLAPDDLPDDVLTCTLPSQFCLPDLLRKRSLVPVRAPTCRVRPRAGDLRLRPRACDVQLRQQQPVDHRHIDRHRRRHIPARRLPRLHPSGDLVAPTRLHPRPLRLRPPARRRCASRRDADGFRRLDAGVAGRPVWTFDPRNNRRCKGRIVIGRGRDASDVAMVTSFGAPARESMSVYATEGPP